MRRPGGGASSSGGRPDEEGNRGTGRPPANEVRRGCGSVAHRNDFVAVLRRVRLKDGDDQDQNDHFGDLPVGGCHRRSRPPTWATAPGLSAEMTTLPRGATPLRS